MKKVVLLTEAEKDIPAANRRLLERNGYAVKSAATLAETRQRLEQRQPDLLILDTVMPDGSGFEFCRAERQRNPGLPILFLTVMGENSDVVRGLRAGADDYLTKPCDQGVFLARVEALLRRAGRETKAAETKKIGNYTVDCIAHRVYQNGRDTLLKPREFGLFRFLLENEGEYFQPEMLYSRVWALCPNGDMRTVYAHISGLRSKLGLRENNALFLEQKRGNGYRLVVNSRQR